MPSAENRLRILIERFRTLFLLTPFFYLATAFASSHLTPKQLKAFAKHVGKTYWVVAAEGKSPLFYSAPSSSASSLRTGERESFRITEMAGASTQKPYYRVRFSSGREGYISVDSFLEEFNSTLLAQDPDHRSRQKSEKEESRREARIRSQPWPEHVKEAVLKRQAILGMNMNEAKAALGKPARVVKLRQNNSLMGEQEQWIYENGPVLTFTNGIITRMQSVEAKAE